MNLCGICVLCKLLYAKADYAEILFGTEDVLLFMLYNMCGWRMPCLSENVPNVTNFKVNTRKKFTPKRLYFFCLILYNGSLIRYIYYEGGHDVKVNVSSMLLFLFLRWHVGGQVARTPLLLRSSGIRASPDCAHLFTFFFFILSTFT